MIHPPPYETLNKDSVWIRPYRPTDINGHLEAATESSAEVYPWLPWCNPKYTRDDAEIWVISRPQAWEQGNEYSFVITDANNRFLGSVGLNTIDFENQRANLGYWVRSSACGMGLATAATELAVEFAFKTVQLKRVEILAAVENKASQRVAEKAAAIREGILRSRLILHGRSHDVVAYSLISTDNWQAHSVQRGA